MRKGAVALESLGIEVPRVGSRVGQVGHGLRGVWTYATVRVADIHPGGSERPVFQTQLPVNPGCSGGPIVDREGQGVGGDHRGPPAGPERRLRHPHRPGAARAAGPLRPPRVAGDPQRPKDVPALVDGKMAGKGPRVVIPAQARSYEVAVVHQGRPRREKVAWPARRSFDLTK